MTLPLHQNKKTSLDVALIYAIAILFVGLFLIYPVVNLLTSSVMALFDASKPLPDGFFGYMLKVTWNTLFPRHGISDLYRRYRRTAHYRRQLQTKRPRLCSYFSPQTEGYADSFCR